MSFCCTCALPLSDTKVPYSTETEKPLTFTRILECCNRTICASCQYDNPRFETYCPFCQISSEPGSALPQTGLRLPPAYDARQTGAPSEQHPGSTDSPPPYSAVASASGGSNSTAQSSPPDVHLEQDDTVHHLNSDDTLTSLSLLYRVPLPVLRTHNALYSDHLISGRKFILIPRSHYNGPSLSQPPDPVEEEKKIKVRRWMVATKCSDYDVAGLYLKGADWNLEIAVESYRSDDKWEKEHPMKNSESSKGKAKKTTGTSMTQQLR